jgi:hypothetical protein
VFNMEQLKLVTVNLDCPYGMLLCAVNCCSSRMKGKHSCVQMQEWAFKVKITYPSQQPHWFVRLDDKG